MGALAPFKVDVLCASSEAKLLPTDESLKEYASRRFRSIYPLTLSPLGKGLLQTPKLGKLGKAFSRFPDEAVYLNRAAYAKALELGPTNYACIFTWSQYHSSHLAGLKIKKKFPQVPWLVHLSDPWVDNPFNSLQWATKPLNTYFESQVFEKADAILLTSERTKELILKRYPSKIREKTSVIPHPFDESLYPAQIKRKDDTFLIRYLGKFYGPRNPSSLFEAVEKIWKNTPEKLRGVRFEFIGSGRPGAAVPESASFLPPCDYKTSLEKMCEADLLLVIDAPFENTVFLPSKLVDYIGAGKPVFGITPDGTSKEVIERLGGECAHPSSVSEIAEKLLRAIEKAKAVPKLESDGERQKYSLNEVGRRTRLAIEAVLR